MLVGVSPIEFSFTFHQRTTQHQKSGMRHVSRRWATSLRWNEGNESISKCLTPPSEWYTSPDILASEQKKVFRKYPQYVGHQQRLSQQKGSYFTGLVLNEPYIVIRQDENEIASFFNVCRHHASQLALCDSGCIDEKGLKCPYVNNSNSGGK